jgi:type IV pilus assembly protein PilA
MRTGQNGFNLIELMAVVATVAILAAVAIPAYQEYTVRAKIVEALAWIAKIRHQIALVTDTTGAPPPNNSAAGLDPVPSNNTSPYVQSVNVNNGTITVGFQNTGNATVDTGTLELLPDTSAGNRRWLCRANDAALYPFLPPNCRNVPGS